MLGTFLSDFYLGRYATLGLASVASFLVMVLLKVTAIVSSLHARAVVAGSLMVAAVGVGVQWLGLCGRDCQNEISTCMRELANLLWFMLGHSRLF
jgi:hypothetical protein